MKAIKYISLFFILLNISCCVNQKKKDEEQIKNTVKEYWQSVKSNNEENYLKLVDASDEYKFAMLNQLHHLNRNYSKIKNIVEAKEISNNRYK